MSITSPTQNANSSADETPAFRYTAALANEIEQRRQDDWAQRGTFRTANPGDAAFDETKPKFYCLDMFPYPSGSGLHVGHPEGYTATDIVSRYKRHKGFNVLHPMGWDAFGLPAEQYAVQTNVHPAETTRRAIDIFRGQLQRFGFSYDWSREFATTQPGYYKWTQWIWLKAYNAWYDPRVDRARPIEELKNELVNGDFYISPTGELIIGGIDIDVASISGSPVGYQRWHELEQDQRRAVIDDQRLAYLGEQTVNWCPKLGTVLANEEIIDGKSERGGYPVIRRPLRQWMFRITAYAERLLRDLENVDWPESTRAMQQAWIGRSEGAEIDFQISDSNSQTETIGVYTTRPDTLFGATYLVLAPEHPLVDEILENPTPESDVDRVREYVELAKNRSDVDRMAESKVKTGVFTGLYAINPATSEQIPIWIADYVLMGYGHGAIMAVPAHDQRDFEFAKTFNLPITQVVEPPEYKPPEKKTPQNTPQTADGNLRTPRNANDSQTAYADPGLNINSTNEEVSLDGLPTPQAKEKIIDWLQDTGTGQRKVNYKLRDWLFSRQRYWGEPFPVVYDEAGNHYPVSETNLPVTLPELADFQPVESQQPTPPLGKATAWVNTTAGEAGVSEEVLDPETPVRRETNTMPNWAGSCWYYLRFCDSDNRQRFVGEDAEAYWMKASTEAKPLLTTNGSKGPIGRSETSASAESPTTSNAGVDLYIGGAEHAVLHLLYARFWHKVLYDLGEVSTPEPFAKVFHQGMILSYAYQLADKSLVPVDEVQQRGENEFIETATGQPVEQIVAKMSKSLRNVINPETVIAQYGADTFRMYEMYMGPLEASKPWNTRDINGLFRFLQRVWRLMIDEQTGEVRATTESSAESEIEKNLHRTIAKVGEDIENLSLNTAIAAMIEFVNEATGVSPLSIDQLRRFLIILSPFAPHIAEELWAKVARLSEPDEARPNHESDSISHQPWPTYDPALLMEDEIELPVQIMGKVRGRITVSADADEQQIEQTALADEKIADALEGKTIRKVIVVKGKIVNIVAS